MTTGATGAIAADRLKLLIERIERLEEEKQTIANDIKEVFAESKMAGFDVKIMRKIISLRKMESQELEEQELLMETYRRALGMLPAVDEAA